MADLHFRFWNDLREIIYSVSFRSLLMLRLSCLLLSKLWIWEQFLSWQNISNFNCFEISAVIYRICFTKSLKRSRKLWTNWRTSDKRDSSILIEVKVFVVIGDIFYGELLFHLATCFTFSSFLFICSDTIISNRMCSSRRRKCDSLRNCFMRV